MKPRRFKLFKESGDIILPSHLKEETGMKYDVTYSEKVLPAFEGDIITSGVGRNVTLALVRKIIDNELHCSAVTKLMDGAYKPGCEEDLFIWEGHYYVLSSIKSVVNS